MSPYDVVVIGWGRTIAAFCMEMLTWTDRLPILTHGHDPAFVGRSAEGVRRFRIGVRTQPIERIIGKDGQVERAVFRDGSDQEFDAMFFHIATGPGCSIPAELGCKADEEGILETNADLETTVPGVNAAADIVRRASSPSAPRRTGRGRRWAFIGPCCRRKGGCEASASPDPRMIGDPLSVSAMHWLKASRTCHSGRRDGA